jgi:hypothetical protein
VASTASNVDSLLERTRRIYFLPLSDAHSSVHVDIPRLISKISIFDMSHGDSQPVAVLSSSSISSFSTEDKVGVFLRVMAEQLGDTASAELVTQHYEQTVAAPRDAEFSIRLREFLVDRLGESSRVACLLRACSQSIIAPLVVAMNAGRLSPRSKAKQKAALNSFNSVRGSWRLDITTHANHVVVRHQKKERTNNEAHNFIFEWNAEMILSPCMKELRDMHVTIGALEFVDSSTITVRYQNKVRKRMILRLRELIMSN